MRILVTGGSSSLGACVLPCLLADERAEVWCAVHQRDVPIDHPRLRRIKLNLLDEIDLDEISGAIDLVIHFAGVTHARDEHRYRDVNYHGTMRLAQSARLFGCRQFVYVSTRCATSACGAYGESKRASEEDLQKLEWDRLLILRPAEVYGGNGNEGVDKFLQWAKRFHVVPLLWGHKGLQFAPLHVDDFVNSFCDLLSEHQRGVSVLDVCGPESLSGAALAWRIARRYKALPLPLWWPVLVLALRAFRWFGIYPVVPDQVARLVGNKTASSSTSHPLLNRPMTRFLSD